MSNDNFDSMIPDEFKDYVHYIFGSFAVKNNRNGISITFGRFGSIDKACAATNLLKKHDWDMELVKNDSICEYENEFWVFKIANNNLIFHKKFDSFEEAVEYLEINSRCNDYHNDVLQKKKKKSRFENLNHDSFIENKKIPNIFHGKKGFIVKYKPHGKEYGVFDSIDEAIVAKDILIKNNWMVSSSIEMNFYNSYYWVFKVDNNVLSFIDKFESYEDALDCLDSNKINIKSQNNQESLFGGVIRGIDNDYIEDIKNDDYVIEANFIKSVKDKSNLNLRHITDRGSVVHASNNKSKSNKSKSNKSKSNKNKKRKSKNHEEITVDIELLKSINRKNIKIKEIEETYGENILIIFKNLEFKLNIVKFQDNVLKDYYSINCLPNGEIDFSSNFLEFNEFDYIWKIVNFYKGDLNRLSNLSSIHYFNGGYYIIKVFDNKLIISGSFDSYSDAESNIEFLHEYYSKPYTIENYPHNIEHYGNVFRLSETHYNKNFEMEGFKSFEDLKAVIDIFEYHDWNPDIFKDYDIFYYHGIYWILDYFFYYVKLKARFCSKDDAIDYKFK